MAAASRRVACGSCFMLLGTVGVTDAFVLTREEEERTHIIPWAASPNKCMDVDGDSAGAELQLWDCNDYSGAHAISDLDWKFVLPELNCDGPIMWAMNPALCFNAPRGDQLQLWYCDTAPPANTRWRITEDGRIRLSSRPELCVTNPLGIPQNGHKLKLQDCADSADISAQINVIFALPTSTTTSVTTTSSTFTTTTMSTTTTHTSTSTSSTTRTWTTTTITVTSSTTTTSPRPCRWTDWSQWSDCDETCHEYQDRHIWQAGQAHGIGCEKESTRFRSCHGGLCR